MYNLDNNWYMVEKDDYIFMASYCIQGGYGVGKDDFIYIYSKDCNRDEENIAKPKISFLAWIFKCFL